VGGVFTGGGALGWVWGGGGKLEIALNRNCVILGRERIDILFSAAHIRIIIYVLHSVIALFH
jgi:hypothetical protein